MLRTARFFLSVCTGLFLVPADAFARPVDLALVLLIDDSASIDETEHHMQLAGYAAAFRDRQVTEAITRGPHKAIAVTAVLFSDRAQVAVPWRLLDGPASASKFADEVLGISRIEGAATHIAKGLDFSMNQIARCPYDFAAATIDLSGDGWDNENAPVSIGLGLAGGILAAVTGVNLPVQALASPIANRRLTELRDFAARKGITINCVAIEEPRLQRYFAQMISAGPSSFTVFAPSFRAFTGVVHQKLLREIREGVKLSEARSAGGAPRSVQDVRKAKPVAKTDSSGKKSAQAKTGPSAPSSAESEAAPDAGASSDPATPGTVIAEPAPAPLPALVIMERGAVLIVRDARTGAPLDSIKVETLPPSVLVSATEPVARPGTVLLEIEHPEGIVPRIRVSCPLYESAEVGIKEGETEVLLEKMPLRIIM